MREELDARFARAVAGVPRPDDWPPFALPAAVAVTLVEAARLDACPPSAVDFYTQKMPALLVEQLQPIDRARALLQRPIGEAPKLRRALAGLFATLHAEKIDAQAFTGAASAEALLAARPSVAALYAHSLFGSGLPLLGAFPEERAFYDRELDGGDPDRVIDLRLSGNLIHELCHGPPAAHATRPAPWLVAEAAALTLGAAARAAHIFPDEPGEAVPGVSLFVCIGSALARRWGRGALFRVLAGEPLARVAGEHVAQALEAAAWQDWLERREPPFVRDALGAMAWIKLAELARRDASPLGADLLAAADATPWSQLPWWQGSQFSLEEVEEAVTAVLQVNVMAPVFQTHPSEPPDGRLHVDVEACTVFTERRADGVFGEPAWWLLPPPMARRLWERGARRLRVDGVRRSERHGIARALYELALGDAPLPEEKVVTWTSSR